MGGLGCRAVISRSDWSICRTDKVQTTLLVSTQWSRTERIVLLDVGTVVKKKNKEWFGVVRTLIDDDIRQNSGQNYRFPK